MRCVPLASLFHVICIRREVADPPVRSLWTLRKAAKQSNSRLLRQVSVPIHIQTVELVAGSSAAWLAHLTGGQGVGGSNPLCPTKFSR